MFYEIARGLVNFVFHIWFHITVVGKENIPKAKGGYIIASNHVSNNDPPMVGIVFKGKYTFMAKDELFHFNPIFTWLIKKLEGHKGDRQRTGELKSRKNLRDFPRGYSFKNGRSWETEKRSFTDSCTG